MGVLGCSGHYGVAHSVLPLSGDGHLAYREVSFELHLRLAYRVVSFGLIHYSKGGVVTGVYRC